MTYNWDIIGGEEQPFIYENGKHLDVPISIEKPNIHYGLTVGNVCGSTNIEGNIIAAPCAEKPMLMIFPNPAFDYIKVQINNYKLPKNDEVTLKLTNQIGQVITELKANELTEYINLSELASGTYTMTLYEAEKMISSEKLVVKQQ